MAAVKHTIPVRRLALGVVGFAMCGLTGLQCWDMRQAHLRDTRLYREFDGAEVIAQELTNGGWVVREAPARPGPYRLFPGQIGSPSLPGCGISWRAHLGRDEIAVRREAPPGQSIWIVPLETNDARLTFMVLESKPELTTR